MIDGWFSVLVISFISSVGGLAVLLIQASRGELREQSEEADMARMQRPDGKRAPVGTRTESGALAADDDDENEILRTVTEIHSLGSYPSPQGR